MFRDFMDLNDLGDRADARQPALALRVEPPSARGLDPADVDQAQLAHQFLEFCRGKPADDAYWHINPHRCALAQFGLPGLTDANCAKHGISVALFHLIVSGGPNNFGALTSRLESVVEGGGLS